MRRLLLPLAVLALCASACGDDSSPETSDPTSTTTAPTTSSPVPDPTSPSTTTEPQGMCGDLVPVVTDEGTTCVDPDTPASTTTPSGPPQLAWSGIERGEGTVPPLLVADGTLVSLVVHDGDAGDSDDEEAYTTEIVLETAHPVFDIRQASDGTVFTQEIVDNGDETFRHVVAVYRPGAARVVLDGVVQLFDVATIEGVESVVVGVGATDDIAYGGVVARDVARPETVVADFDLAAEAEFWVTHADYSGGRLVYSALSDLTESVGYRGRDGATFRPTDDLEYNAPPFVTAASLSADGQTVYWAEGPDWDHRADDFAGGWVPAQWMLLGADVETGERAFSRPLSGTVDDTAELGIESIIDLGERVLVNRSTLVGTEAVLLRALVLDPTEAEPVLRELPIAGAATPAAI